MILKINIRTICSEKLESEFHKPTNVGWFTMSNEYNQITAKHYAAFRPSLHLPILDRCIEKEKRYELGLDIGSGTGQSSIALVNYCDRVIGIEPSTEMLAAAIAHSRVAYHHGDGEHLDFESEYFDIITFAGSLYYAKSQKLLNEVVRVSKPFAKIITYDFEILLTGFLDSLHVRPNEKVERAYNHQENFSGLQTHPLKLLEMASAKISVPIQSSELAHLILSEKNAYESLQLHLGPHELHRKIENRLIKMSNGKKHETQATIFYSVYECAKLEKA